MSIGNSDDKRVKVMKNGWDQAFAWAETELLEEEPKHDDLGSGGAHNLRDEKTGYLSDDTFDFRDPEDGQPQSVNMGRRGSEGSFQEVGWVPVGPDVRMSYIA